MKNYYNTKIKLEGLSGEMYDKLIDLLEDNNFHYEETDFEEYVVDERSEQEKYDDWLSEQADNYNDEKWMGLR